ncbi:hypothetical protein DFH08DRAFT_825086 [Mycena albidolilacea]|uniref:Uncharacterized protein n=1 Tax=Mycena albidolilacea TaxID=1033008 RepID=A0AAD6Z2M7_9AGAR|nr:hypothetical protein DFH08DRAFT_825086 [Mycena albidolilacea]
MSDPVVPHLMTVLSPSFACTTWREFMVADLGFTNEGVHVPTGYYAGLARYIMDFTHARNPGRRVRIMVSCVGNMAELFLRTPTTLDCNAISARSIISAYVDLTSELRGTHGFVHASAKPYSVIGTPAYHSLSAPLSPFPGLVALHPDTRSLGRPCGLACPALPRYSEGMAGIGQWRWGGLVTNMGMYKRRSATMPVLNHNKRCYLRFVPAEVLGEILQFACGDYFDPERPFATDHARFRCFVTNRTAFVRVATSWRDAAYAAGPLWSALIVKPKQRKDHFAFLVSRMNTEPVHIRVELRGPDMCMPPPTTSEVSVRDIIHLLEHKSSACATLGIYSENRPLFWTFADALTTCHFPLLTALTIANIEPCVDQDGRAIQLYSSSILSGRRLSHLRLVGFGFPLAQTDVFTCVCVLVLSDLGFGVAPTVPELYVFLLCATRLEALSIDRIECGVVFAANDPIILEHLDHLHFFCAGNKALQALLLQLRAPMLTMFDAKVLSADDACFLEECGPLLAPVTNLRIYGIHSSAKTISSLVDMMPSVTDIDLTTTSHSLAACLSAYGRGWQSMSRMRLEDPVIPGWTKGLRPVQEDLASANLDGEDVLCCTATGGGKSALPANLACANTYLLVSASAHDQRLFLTLILLRRFTWSNYPKPVRARVGSNRPQAEPRSCSLIMSAASRQCRLPTRSDSATAAPDKDCGLGIIVDCILLVVLDVIRGIPSVDGDGQKLCIQNIEQDRLPPTMSGDDLSAYDDLAAQEGPNSRRVYLRKNGLSIQTKGLRISTLSEPPPTARPEQPPLPPVRTVLRPTHLKMHHFDSRFLPHLTTPIRCLLPLQADCLLLIGHDEGLSVLDMYPQDWNDSGGIDLKGPEDAAMRPIWEGESVFQMLKLDHTGSVVLMLVGSRVRFTARQGPGVSAHRTNGAHPLNLGTFAAQNTPMKKNRPTSSIVARGLKSLVPTATSSSSGASESSSSYQPLLTPQSGSSSQRPSLAAPVRPPPRTNSAEGSWEMVDDLPLRWSQDFVPLVLAESRLVNASVLSCALWTRDEGPSLVELYEHANGAEHDENREPERQKSKALEPSSKAQAYTSHSLLGMVRLGSSGAFRVYEQTILLRMGIGFGVALISHLDSSSHALCNTMFCNDYEFADIKKEKMAVLKRPRSLVTLGAPSRPIEFLVFGEVAHWGKSYFENLNSAVVRFALMIALASALKSVSDAEWNSYGPDTVHLTASVLDLEARMGVVCANALMTASRTEGGEFVLELFATNVEALSICF